MRKKNKKEHQITNSYAFNKTASPLPDSTIDKIKPPISFEEIKSESVEIKKEEEKSLEQQAQEYMDTYRKAERIIVINFYTGGGAYKKGVLDAIYRGFNPMNP